MRILGLSAFYHDSAAAVVVDGIVTAAAQEERFTRKKHDASFPSRAIAYCLGQNRCSLADFDAVVFYEKPLIKFERLLETYLSFAPRGFASFRTAMPVWLREKLFQKRMLTNELSKLAPAFDAKSNLLFSEHHLSHAASAFYPSPYREAAILTMDGVGEWSTTSLAVGQGSTIKQLQDIHFPHSIGLLYSAFTYYLGFKVNSGEYKVMGLAPYGTPKYARAILDSIIDVKPDGSFRLAQEYFDYCTGLTMTNARFGSLFGQPVRDASEQLTQFHMDMAASIQAVTEEVVVKLARSARKLTGQHNLCLAGGVALNCVANGKILREGIFDNIWIQPASGDAGGALGAALVGYHTYFRQPRVPCKTGGDAMQGSYLGPSFDNSYIESRLVNCGAKFATLSDGALLEATAEALAEGKAVGWMQGRMEYGPRALGARSILGDPRSASMQKNLNLKVKYRESFRPFAPSVLREEVRAWFELDADSPYMLLVAPVRSQRRRVMSEEENALFGIDKLNVPRSEIPAVTHVDYSARVQTVHKGTNPIYHALISRFRDLTGCPVLINTSFNVRGEPIVCTPEDAFLCFMGTEIDVLAIGNCFLRKEEQDPKLKLDYKNAFDLD
jgi:carbamoyltransferase